VLCRLDAVANCDLHAGARDHADFEHFTAPAAALNLRGEGSISSGLTTLSFDSFARSN
jgi:hypothetical protein